MISLDVGGLERVVLALVQHGRALGRDVAVACLERPGKLAPLAEAAGTKIYCMDKPPGLRPGTVDRLRQSFDHFRPDVVHTHQIGALYYAGPAARRHGIGTVVHTEHIDHSLRCKHLIDRLRVHLLWGLAGRHTKRFFGVSEDIVASVSAFGLVPKSKLMVVRNGIETATFAPAANTPRGAMKTIGIPEGVKVVGTVGRLAEIKCQDVMIRGFALASAIHPEARLVLVGDGPNREALEALARSLGIADRVYFAGYQERPELFVREMDVFALTSRLEGLPLAILEAWAAAVPVIATAVGGVASLIQDGEDGGLVPADDAPAIAQAIISLLANPKQARRIGESGRVRAVSEFDVGIMAEAYDRHYEAVLGRC